MDPHSFCCRLLLAASLLVFSAALGEEESNEAWEEELEAMERELEELERELEEYLEAGQSDWMSLISLQGGFGHRDNVLRSAVSRTDGFFLYGGFDFFLLRQPDAGPQLDLFLFAENLHFLRDGDFNDERLAALQVEVSREVTTDWALSAPFHVHYYDEFADVSTREEELGTVRFRGISMAAEPGVTWRPLDSHRFGGKAIGRQVFLRSPLDDYREVGPEVSWDHAISPRTEIDLSARSLWRRYSSREALESDGTAIDGRRREFTIHRIRGGLDRYWDDERRWRSRFGGGLEINRDNGGGYFDFSRPFVSHRLQYRRSPWSLGAGGRLSYYHYSTRAAGQGSDSDLRRTVVDANLRADYEVVAGLHLSAEYTHDTVSTNQSDAGYRVNTTVFAAEWSF